MLKIGFRWGYQTEIARQLGVSRSTICRDVRRLFDQCR
jgi:IS30 family transposase